MPMLIVAKKSQRLKTTSIQPSQLRESTFPDGKQQLGTRDITPTTLLEEVSHRSLEGFF